MDDTLRYPIGDFQPQNWARTLSHPKSGIMGLDRLLALCAWHGRHHVAQIDAVRQRMDWNGVAVSRA